MNLIFFCVIACVNAVEIPSSMIALHREGLGCFTPFKCVATHKVKTPSPKEGEILIQVAASSVNPCDVDYVEFGVGCTGGKGTLGMDASGTVVAVGKGCDRLKVGDEVWADVGGVSGDTGAMAQFAILSEAQTGLKPTSLNMTEAGTIPLVGLTALEMLVKTGAPWTGRSNVTVAITSGSGGTGFMAVQLAKRAFDAAYVVTAASGEDNIAWMKQLGADKVVDYKVQELFDALPDDSVDIVIDNYGAKGTADKAMHAIRTGGVYLVLPGGNGGTISKHPKAGVKQINYGLTTSKDYHNLDILKNFFEQHGLVAHLYASVPLQSGAQAFALSKTGKVDGKVAVTVPQS